MSGEDRGSLPSFEAASQELDKTFGSVIRFDPTAERGPSTLAISAPPGTAVVDPIDNMNYLRVLLAQEFSKNLVAQPTRTPGVARVAAPPRIPNLGCWEFGTLHYRALLERWPKFATGINPSLSREIAFAGKSVRRRLNAFRDRQLLAELFEAVDRTRAEFAAALDSLQAAFLKNRGIPSFEIWTELVPAKVEGTFKTDQKLAWRGGSHHEDGPVPAGFRDQIPEEIGNAAILGLGLVTADVTLSWIDEVHTSETIFIDVGDVGRSRTVRTDLAKLRYDLVCYFVPADGSARIEFRRIWNTDPGAWPVGKEKTKPEEYFTKYRHHQSIDAYAEVLIGHGTELGRNALDADGMAKIRTKVRETMPNFRKHFIDMAENALQGNAVDDALKTQSEQLRTRARRVVGCAAVIRNVVALGYPDSLHRNDVYPWLYSPDGLPNQQFFSQLVERYRDSARTNAGVPLTTFVAQELRRSFGYRDGRLLPLQNRFQKFVTPLPDSAIMQKLKTWQTSDELARQKEELEADMQVSSRRIVGVKLTEQQLDGGFKFLCSINPDSRGLPAALMYVVARNGSNAPYPQLDYYLRSLGKLEGQQQQDFSSK